MAIEPRSAPVVAAYDLHLMVDMSYRDRLGMKGPYFNSGVLALDLKAIRAGRIFDQARRYAITHADRCRMHDQDALNAVLDGNWQVLGWRWNAMNYLSNLMPRKAFIRHFSGYKPWTPKKVGVERRYRRGMARRSGRKPLARALPGRGGRLSHQTYFRSDDVGTGSFLQMLGLMPRRLRQARQPGAPYQRPAGHPIGD